MADSNFTRGANLAGAVDLSSFARKNEPAGAGSGAGGPSVDCPCALVIRGMSASSSPSVHRPKDSPTSLFRSMWGTMTAQAESEAATASSVRPASVSGESRITSATTCRRAAGGRRLADGRHRDRQRRALNHSGLSPSARATLGLDFRSTTKMRQRWDRSAKGSTGFRWRSNWRCRG